MERAEDKKEIDLIEQLENEYFNVLKSIENHTEYDYLCLRFSLRNKNKDNKDNKDDEKNTLPEFTFFNRIKWEISGLNVEK